MKQRKFKVVRARENFICQKCHNQRAIERKGVRYCSKHKKYNCPTRPIEEQPEK